MNERDYRTLTKIQCVPAPNLNVLPDPVSTALHAGPAVSRLTAGKP